MFARSSRKRLGLLQRLFAVDQLRPEAPAIPGRKTGSASRSDINEPPLLGSVVRDKRHASGAISGKASAPETIFAKLAIKLSGLWRPVVRVAAASPFSGEN